MAKNISESILDNPRDTLCPEVWNIQSNPPVLTDEAQRKIDRIIHWVQSKYNLNDLSAYIIGSICSNSYSEDSDIDIDFCAAGAVKDDGDEDAVKEFGYHFKQDFIDNYVEKFPEDSMIGNHPFEVYFNPNPFQCFMSVGCYNVIEHKWEVGPEMKEQDFDPVSQYYADAMKQADKILKDIRTIIFELYEAAFACKKSNDIAFKKSMQKDIKDMLDNASSLYDSMKIVRSNFQKPCKSREEALKRRKDKKQHIVDAAFKFLDKFGYISILKDFVQLKYDIKDDVDALEDADIRILKSVSSNMQLKKLQDSPDADDKKMTAMMQEVESMLNEDASGLVKMSFIAALMAVSSLLPAGALTKNLNKAKHNTPNMTVNSPAVKKAIAASAIDNEMVGPMSKTNVVNALAKCLWSEARGKNEGTAGRKAVASVVMNRTGNKPAFIIDVLKQPAAFSYITGYKGGWTDSSYQWFLPYNEIAKNPNNKAIWDECNSIALQVVNGTFKSTIGNRNAYLNKDTADKKNVDSWGKKCTYKVGSHHFGYLKDRDPKYVIPGTYTVQKKNTAKDAQRPIAKFTIVKSGDTLSKIAKDNNTTLTKLVELNKGLKDINALNIGQKIRIA